MMELCEYDFDDLSFWECNEHDSFYGVGMSLHDALNVGDDGNYVPPEDYSMGKAQNKMGGILRSVLIESDKITMDDKMKKKIDRLLDVTLVLASGTALVREQDDDAPIMYAVNAGVGKFHVGFTNNIRLRIISEFRNPDETTFFCMMPIPEGLVYKDIMKTVLSELGLEEGRHMGGMFPTRVGVQRLINAMAVATTPLEERKRKSPRLLEDSDACAGASARCSSVCVASANDEDQPKTQPFP